VASLIGTEIGKYRITERIGRGGMAEVYEGIHTHLDRKVAVKVLHSHLLEGGDFVARFKREAKAVANLRHPNIVQVHDFDIQEDLIFMVMEFIDGDNLHTKLVEVGKKGERMPIKLIGSIINDIASALDYAHSKGMLHRDIKPSNIMIDQDDKAYLTDFGIAKLLDDTKFTATGQLVGTPAYMSPEQGMGEDLSEESDIYSLGVVAFEMLTGQVPYDAKTPIGIVHKQINDPVPNLSELVDGVPGTAQQVIDRALSKSPGSRYSSAEALVGALRVALYALESPESVPVMVPEDPPTVVDDGLDAPTVTMEAEDLEQATVVMEKEVKKEQPKKKKPKEKPAPKPKGEKKKIPVWGYIAGGVALLAVGGVILTQVLGFGLPATETDIELEPGSIMVYTAADGESDSLQILNDGDVNYELVEIKRDRAWQTGNCESLTSPDGNSTPDIYLDFDIADDAIHQLPEGSDVSIFVDYYDQGTDGFRLEYDSHLGGPHSDGRWRETGEVIKTDTGKFLTAEFKLDNPFLGDRNSDSDFRLNDYFDGAEVVRKVTVIYVPGEEVMEEPVTADGEEFFHKGVELYHAENYEGAMELFDQAFAAGLDTVELRYHTGLTRWWLGDDYMAIEDLTIATDRDPDHFDAWYALAEAYSSTGEDRYKGLAHEALDHALALDPENANAHWLMGKVRYEMFDNPEEAVEDFTRAIELNPEFAFFYNARGVVYLETGQWELCIPDYNEFVARDPDNPWAYKERGDCYIGVGDHDAARADYEHFMALTESAPEDWVHLHQQVQNWLDNNP